MGVKSHVHALVAQLDRVLDYESRGRGFESSPARHFPYNLGFFVRGVSPLRLSFSGMTPLELWLRL